MKTIKITASFTYDDELAHGPDAGAQEWFLQDILKGPYLQLHSGEIGDFIGDIEILTVEEQP